MNNPFHTPPYNFQATPRPALGHAILKKSNEEILDHLATPLFDRHWPLPGKPRPTSYPISVHSDRPSLAATLRQKLIQIFSPAGFSNGLRHSLAHPPFREVLAILTGNRFGMTPPQQPTLPPTQVRQ